MVVAAQKAEPGVHVQTHEAAQKAELRVRVQTHGAAQKAEQSLRVQIHVAASEVHEAVLFRQELSGGVAVLLLHCGLYWLETAGNPSGGLFLEA